VDAQSLTVDARALAARFDSQLRLERRASPHTARAYVATAHRLLDFLTIHRGEPASPADLTRLEATDLRAFLARRRGEGLGASAAAREMSAVSAFLRFVAEQLGAAAVLPRIATPKRPRTLPRPAAPELPATWRVGHLPCAAVAAAMRGAWEWRSWQPPQPLPALTPQPQKAHTADIPSPR
jgi:integrase/recombinase XerC